MCTCNFVYNCLYSCICDKKVNLLHIFHFVDIIILLFYNLQTDNIPEVFLVATSINFITVFLACSDLVSTFAHLSHLCSIFTIILNCILMSEKSLLVSVVGVETGNRNIYICISLEHNLLNSFVHALSYTDFIPCHSASSTHIHITCICYCALFIEDITHKTITSTQNIQPYSYNKFTVLYTAIQIVSSRDELQVNINGNLYTSLPLPTLAEGTVLSLCVCYHKIAINFNYLKI